MCKSKVKLGSLSVSHFTTFFLSSLKIDRLDFTTEIMKDLQNLSELEVTHSDCSH